MPSSPHILIVDDDIKIQQLLKRFLERRGYTVSSAEDAVKARRILSLFRPDLIILDVMMPGESGLDLAASLRQSISTPILMLTAMDATPDRIKGLRSGADDYLCKPFDPEELVLRIANLLRRYVQESVRPIIFGSWTLSKDDSSLKSTLKTLSLSQAQLQLLSLLIEESPNAVPRETLSAHCQHTNIRSVDVQIKRLRDMIEEDPNQPRFIRTIRGEGYAFYH